MGLGSNFGQIYFYCVAARSRHSRESGNLKAVRTGSPPFGDDAMAVIKPTLRNGYEY